MIDFWVMLACKIDEGRAAGCRHGYVLSHFFTEFVFFVPSHHIRSNRDFDDLGKSEFFNAHFDLIKIGTVKLTLNGRCDHCDGWFSFTNVIDDIDNPRLIFDRSKWTCGLTGSTVDAFFFIYDSNVVFIIGNRIDRTGCLTRTWCIDDGIEWAGFCTGTTFDTFVVVDDGTIGSKADGIKFTSCSATLGHTFTAIIRNQDATNGTSITSRIQNLNDLFWTYFLIFLHSRAFAHCDTDALTNDFAFLIYTATEIGCHTRNQLISHLIIKFVG